MDQKDFQALFLLCIQQDPAFKSKVREEVGYNDLMQDVANLRAACTKKDKRITELERKTKENEYLFDSLEQYSRKNSMRIDGILENETECLMDTVLHLYNSRMRVDPPIRPEDIDRVHRLGSKSPSKVRTVLVKFVSGRIKDRVFRCKARLKLNAADTDAVWKPLPATGFAPSTTEFPELTPGTGPASIQPAAEASSEASAETTGHSANGNERSAGDNELSTGNDTGNDTTATQIPDSIVKAIGKKVYLNDDLTNARDFMLYVARQSKRRGHINDVWVVNGMIKIKDLANTVSSIRELESIPDFDAIRKEAEARRKPQPKR